MVELLTAFASANPCMAWLLAIYVMGVPFTFVVGALCVMSDSDGGRLTRRQAARVAFIAMIWPVAAFDIMTGH